MNFVEPIRDMDRILDISEYLRLRSERDYVLFMFGLYSGLRVSDILKLRVRDVRNKGCILMREKKTGKDKRIEVHEDLRKILKDYIKDRKDFEYLFRSHKGANSPITRVQAYRILNSAARVFGMESIGTHTLRKTFGYHLYQSTKDSILVKEALNHSDAGVTLRYIGIRQDDVNQAVRKMSFVK